MKVRFISTTRTNTHSHQILFQFFLLSFFNIVTLIAANGIHDLDGNIIEGLAPEEIAVGASGKLSDREPTVDLYRDQEIHTRGDAPYVPPANMQYDTSGGPKEGMINVHLVPHTHDDTGWQVTVDQYFFREVYYIVDTVVQNLLVNPDRKFIYVETGFFARWWDDANEIKRNQTKYLVERGQLEFINGGWCMHDEASPKWEAMVDQTTRGHQFLLKNFGSKANPRGTWQIDPFGHSNTQAWLLSAEAGMESLFWGRTDYQDFNARYKRSGLEWIWQGSESMGESAQIFAGALFGTGGGGYSTWINFDSTDDQVQDNPERHDYNVDQWVDFVVQSALDQANHTKTDHQLWACGTDFQYQNSDHWFTNLDKLIHYLKQNGTINAFYSTPSLYVDAKKKDTSVTWEVRQDDIFPLADNAHHYWSGYFTSRPALKRQVRFATNTLAAARQLEVVSGITAEDVGKPTKLRAPRVGDSWTDALEGAVGVATHHDGMSGTERQDVTNDYEQRIAESAVEVEAGIEMSMAKLLGNSDIQMSHCNCNSALDCLNISYCKITSESDDFTVVAWNPIGQTSSSVFRIPVSSTSSMSVTSGDGKTITSQLVEIDNRTKSLPLMYLNKFGMSASEIESAEKELSNPATHELVFQADVPAMGLATFHVTSASSSANQNKNNDIEDDTIFTASNEFYTLTFDKSTGGLKSIKNLKSNVETTLSMNMGWYNSSVGGCTKYGSDVPENLREPSCDDQKSGAYIFRPNSSTFFYPGPSDKPVVTLTSQGDVVTEVSQVFSEWATAKYRLYANQPYVEVEWTVGPIPMTTSWIPSSINATENWGKEVVMRYETSLESNGTFYTDSNGKELIRRVYNKRGASYPDPYNISEEVAGNYYPVNAMISIDDGVNELAILADVSVAGGSLSSGSAELMVHRRLQDDDSRGVQEPLNETMCGCNDINADPGNMGEHGHEGDGGCECVGLTMRGKQWLVFDNVNDAHETRRQIAEKMYFPPTLGFTTTKNVGIPSISYLNEDLPSNVKIQTLTNNYAAHNNNQLLLRLSHLYQVGEHTTLSKPVDVDLEKVFGKTGLKIASATEVSLTANQLVEEMDAKKHQWNTAPLNERVEQNLHDAKIKRAGFDSRVPFNYPVVTMRPMEVRTFLVRFD